MSSMKRPWRRSAPGAIIRAACRWGRSKIMVTGSQGSGGCCSESRQHDGSCSVMLKWPPPARGRDGISTTALPHDMRTYVSHVRSTRTEATPSHDVSGFRSQVRGLEQSSPTAPPEQLRADDADDGARRAAHEAAQIHLQEQWAPDCQSAQLDRPATSVVRLHLRSSAGQVLPFGCDIYAYLWPE